VAETGGKHIVTRPSGRYFVLCRVAIADGETCLCTKMHGRWRSPASHLSDSVSLHLVIQPLLHSVSVYASDIGETFPFSALPDVVHELKSDHQKFLMHYYASNRHFCVCFWLCKRSMIDVDPDFGVSEIYLPKCRLRSSGFDAMDCDYFWLFDCKYSDDVRGIFAFEKFYSLHFAFIPSLL